MLLRRWQRVRCASRRPLTFWGIPWIRQFVGAEAIIFIEGADALVLVAQKTLGLD